MITNECLEKIFAWCDKTLEGFFPQFAIQELKSDYRYRSRSAKPYEMVKFNTYQMLNFIGHIDYLNDRITVVNVRNGKSGMSRFNAEADKDFIPYIGIAIAFYRYTRQDNNARLPKDILELLTFNEKIQTTFAEIKTGDIFEIHDDVITHPKYLCIDKFEDKMFVTPDMGYTISSTIGLGGGRFNDVHRIKITDKNRELPVLIVGHDARIAK